MAASAIDGDLHQKLLDSRNFSTELYAKAVAPLVRLHSANPDIYYLYTMVEKNGAAYFVLDTANSPMLKTDKPLEASAYLEKFVSDKSNDWLDQLRHGRTYITPNFEQDDYGTFLSGHTPIYDSEGRYSGFVGVDVDLKYYVALESRFLIIAAGTIVVALLLSLAFGYGVGIYLRATRNRLQDLYRSSVTDSMTGLLNRRGVADLIKPAVEKYTGYCAVLIIDIDGLKLINALQGHTTGDAAVAKISEAIRCSIRDDDLCAKLGDEFIVFAPARAMDDAESLAQNILARATDAGMPMVGVKVSLSIGIAVKLGSGESDFAQMYREADQAVSQAKSEGRNRIVVFQLSAAA
ncbi:MAG TPA: GGDEF domain-containing protein [Sedimentisphaerales bacterium]|nr:GGDEF domain-containing protein [Sedimentisphaerales bacterium]